tara:strand:+ start:28 stop:234 length:207 start_codon:yes stop_codon:yes gene_type:complete
VKRIRSRNFEAAGFDGEKVDSKATITISITPEIKRKIRILAANSGDGYSVSQYLRLLLAEKLGKSDEV